MSCLNWGNMHDFKLTNSTYDFSSTNNLFNKPVLSGTFSGVSGSSVIPEANSVSISGSTGYNLDFSGLSNTVTGCSCVQSNWFPIVSDCGCSNIFSGYGCGGWGWGGMGWGGLWTRGSQSVDNVFAMNNYSNGISWGDTFNGIAKEYVINGGIPGMVQTISSFVSGLCSC